MESAQERIDAAIAAREKATPGPWEAYHVSDHGLWCIAKTENGVVIAPSNYNAAIIAAAPDLADEVARLRKENAAIRKECADRAVEWYLSAGYNIHEGSEGHIALRAAIEGNPSD